MEVLSNDVVEAILERVPAKSLIRFKHVSKQWKSTIESKNFHERQLIYRQQSRDQDVLFLTFSGDDDDDDDDDDDHSINISSSSSSVILVKLPIKKRFVCSTSCDGLVCLYNINKSSIVINPTTRWHRTLPLSNFQQRDRAGFPPLLGFGKDKFNGTYKLVLLYDFGDTTTCEVFDFSTNAWRYVTPSSPYKIIASLAPAYVDGSLHWFTNCLVTKILSFDLHTETFQVIARAPAFVLLYDTKSILMRNLNNRLCVSEKEYSKQVIWLFDSESKAWNEICSIDFSTTSFWYRFHGTPLLPVAVLEEKDKLLFYERDSCRELKIHDDQTKSHDLVFKSKSTGYPLCYFQSLISIS